MKPILRFFLTIVCLLMTGCATRMWDPVTGKKTFETYGDITDLYVDGKKLTAKRINHSVPTRNAMTGVNGIVTEIAAAAVTGGVR